MRAMNQRVDQSSVKIAALAARLETLSPLNVLTRGYSLTHKVGGELVRSGTDVQRGDLLMTRLADGEILSRVENAGQLKLEKPDLVDQTKLKTEPIA